MKRVLFVDDDPNVLSGLRDLLRKQRKHWDMVFATGGQQALEELARGAFDVVVSDMQMPGMNGVALLKRVKEQYPAAARIILSGHAERDAVIDALPVSHQFLSKPCDPEVLRAVVERACGLQALLQNATVRSVVGKVERLPSAPRVYWDLTQLMADPTARLTDMAGVVERDTAMAAKVLQLVNSSYFGVAHQQTSIAQAVTYLGSELLRTLALTAHVFASASPPTASGFSLDALQHHALLVARIAKQLLPDKKQAEQAFLAGIVHDIGKLVLATSIPERYGEVLRNTCLTGRAGCVVELELLGVTHAEVGAYLLGLWGLPLDIVEAVAYHHRPELTAPTAPLLAVYAADALSHAASNAESGSASAGDFNEALFEHAPFGLELSRCRSLAEAELAATKSEAHHSPTHLATRRQP